MSRPDPHALDADELRAFAERCRAQAGRASTHGVRASLLAMARDYQQRAEAADRAAA